VVICLERGAYLHMAQLMPLPLTVSCFSKIQMGFAFLVLAHLGSPGKRAVKQVCVRVCTVSQKWPMLQVHTHTRSGRRMPLLRVQTLLQHFVAVSDPSLVPHLYC